MPISPRPPNKSAAIRTFFIGGLLPVIAFAAIENFYGTAAGLVAGMIFGVGELAYEYWSLQKLQGITIASNVLVIGLGSLSLVENNGAFFKLQPAVLTLALALFLIGSSVLKRPLLTELAKKQRGELPPQVQVRLSGLNLRLGFVLILIALVGVHAAFYWSTPAWAAFKALGAPLLIVVYMVGEFAVIKWRTSRQQSRVQSPGSPTGRG